MKSIMIAAPQSGSGKTLVTSAIVRAMVNRGLEVSPFKTGPDFVDPIFLAKAAKSTAGNLDSYMMGEDGINTALSLNKKDFCVIEGVMGYFDGLGNTYEHSPFDLTEKLDINTIIVYSPKGEMFSVIPKLLGMYEFSKGRIKGVIFNKISKKYYLSLKEAVEKHTPIEVLGYLPLDESLVFEDRGLGLEINERLERAIKNISEQIEKTVNVDRLLELFKAIKLSPIKNFKKMSIKVAVAKDKAFSFMYRENIELVEKLADVVYFSPLEDKTLPRADILMFFSGDIKNYLIELSQNKEMLREIRTYAYKGGFILAEAAGAVYLAKSLDEVELVNIIDEKAISTKRSERFGYVEIEVASLCLLGTIGNKIKAQEFHKSKFLNALPGCLTVTKANNSEKWNCGYKKDNAFMYFQHINFMGNVDILRNILEKVEEAKNAKL